MLHTVPELEKAALDIRKDLLKLCSIQTIHIGGDLSITDIMTVLWQYQMRYNPLNPGDESRDRFVLSKGHASAVTSFNQAAIGCFQKEDVFREYASDGGRFSMHSCRLMNPYVEISTGSLGHGFPVSCGIAAGLRLKGNYHSRVYTIMGDGEQSEGSIWEAAANAARLGLGNLVAIVDCNLMGSDGPLEQFGGMNCLSEKYKAFGWNVFEFDGNNIAQVKQSFDCLPDADSSQPVIFLCRTIKGCGVSFMENKPEWHTGKISAEQYEKCCRSLDEAYEKTGGR